MSSASIDLLLSYLLKVLWPVYQVQIQVVELQVFEGLQASSFDVLWLVFAAMGHK